MAKSINIIFPHQLFSKSKLLENGHEVYIIEEHLFFDQYKFHKQKIAFHRATMKCYEQVLLDKGLKVRYVNSSESISDIRNFFREIKAENITKVFLYDPVDNWLEKRVKAATENCELVMYDSLLFLNSNLKIDEYFSVDKNSFKQAHFYKKQRADLNIMVTNGQPEGGQWSFDADNRKKYPKGKTPPSITFPSTSSYWTEAVSYVHDNFPNNPGTISEHPLYPINFEQAKYSLTQFLEYRFFEFGPYEDAIVKEEVFLNHSILSPLINVGLLTPIDVIETSVTFATEAKIPMNSKEGFVRQIIGWREFIRGMYVSKGSFSRTRNFWKFERKIPESFYSATTGIAPVDDTIKKVLRTGYCHHIERLMVLGNFMLLCEFDPKEVYRWFMELFIDAYDWVMVPNIYGMSQFADGGSFATKPYISGSNYLKKMSNYPKGDWQEVWDGLYWNFIDKHHDFFKSNHRTSMMVFALDKMPNEKREAHLKNAELFLTKLDRV